MVTNTVRKVLEWERLWVAEKGYVPLGVAKAAGPKSESLAASPDVWRAWQRVKARAEKAHQKRERAAAAKRAADWEAGEKYRQECLAKHGPARLR